VADRDAEAAEHTVDIIGHAASAVLLDVADQRAVQNAVAEVAAGVGPITHYFSNAGVATSPGLGDDRGWEAGWSIHCLAHLYGARAVLPSMSERGEGAFIITASAAGLLMTLRSAAYTVTKHGAVALAEWLAVQYRSAGIYVGCVSPQGVRTPLVENDERARSDLAAMGDLLEPTQVADVVLDACADGHFLILPHPEVAKYEAMKIADRDAWLSAMAGLNGRLAARREVPDG